GALARRLAEGVDFQHDLAAFARRIDAPVQIRLHTAAAGAQVGDFYGGLALVDEGESSLERRTAVNLTGIDGGVGEGQVGTSGRGGQSKSRNDGKHRRHPAHESSSNWTG